MNILIFAVRQKIRPGFVQDSLQSVYSRLIIFDFLSRGRGL